MRYFIELSYKGTAYAGWQRQPNAASVQQTIEQALQVLLRKPTPITGCGRTDTGVHASFYIAHFESNHDRVVHKDFIYHLNCVLPDDIAIYRIYECDMHARFDARYREYKYYISRRKNPFITEGSWLVTLPLDVDMMRRAGEILMQYEDFEAMSRTGSNNTHSICKIYKIDWEESENMLTFTIGANRFLRGMVRALVGTMVDVGKGKRTLENMHDIMLSRNRCLASSAAPAQGLFLTNITYKEQ